MYETPNVHIPCRLLCATEAACCSAYAAQALLRGKQGLNDHATELTVALPWHLLPGRPKDLHVVGVTAIACKAILQ